MCGEKVPEWRQEEEGEPLNGREDFGLLFFVQAKAMRSHQRTLIREGQGQLCLSKDHALSSPEEEVGS